MTDAAGATSSRASSSGRAATGHAPTTRERVVAYDLLRIFAAITVVTIHVTAPYLKTNTSLPSTSWVQVFDQSMHYAVPLFTFLSGALSWGALWISGPGRYRAFMLRRWVVVGVPYVAWSILYYFLRPASGMGLPPHDLVGAMRQFIVLLLSGTVYYHLYFLPMLLLLYLVTPLASRAAHKAPELFAAAIYLVAVYGTPWLFAGFDRLPLHRTLGPVVIPLLQNILTFVPFMALGAWFAVRQHQVGRALRWLGAPLLVVGVGLTTALVRGHVDFGLFEPWYYVVSMSVFVLGLLGVALVAAEMPALASGSEWADRVVVLASFTLGVYLIHPLIITFGERKLVDAIGLLSLWHNFGIAMVFDVIAILVSFGLAALLKRWKVTRRFV